MNNELLEKGNKLQREINTLAPLKKSLQKTKPTEITIHFGNDSVTVDNSIVSAGMVRDLILTNVREQLDKKKQEFDEL